MVCNIKEIVVGGDKGLVFISRICEGVAYDHNNQVVPNCYFENFPNLLNIEFEKPAYSPVTTSF
jgi:hypothetical protein